MYGAILGDIVGSPYEFDCNNYKAKDFPLFSCRSDFTDDTVMTLAVAKALAENADAVEKYRAGSDKVFGFLVGRCMAALRGKADPASVNRALREALKR